MWITTSIIIKLCNTEGCSLDQSQLSWVVFNICWEAALALKWLNLCNRKGNSFWLVYVSAIWRNSESVSFGVHASFSTMKIAPIPFIWVWCYLMYSLITVTFQWSTFRTDDFGCSLMTVFKSAFKNPLLVVVTSGGRHTETKYALFQVHNFLLGYY